MNGCRPRPKVTVLICTLNEAESLPYVLPRIPEWVDEVLLVDGHSTDRTVEVAKELRPDIRVLYQPGRGKGDALKYGVREARGEIIVTLDADGETPPEQPPASSNPFLTDTISPRALAWPRGGPSGCPGIAGLAIRFSPSFYLRYGTRYTDICSGFNAFWNEAFLRLPLTSDDFQMEQELLAKAHKLKLKIKEVNHPSPGRVAGRSKTRGLGRGPEAAAELAVFLASEESNGLTGRLISAVWDDWRSLPGRIDQVMASDLYTLRRITADTHLGAKA